VKQKRKYTEEFKREAVRMATAPGSHASAVAKALGMPASALYRWVEQAKKGALKAKESEPGETLEQEVRRLRREVSRLEEERAFIKKAAAFFAKESM
jgi:transposase